MADIIANAAKGQRRALNSLYTSVKNKVYFVAEFLLGDERAASDATVRAIKMAFEAMGNEEIKSEKDFCALAIRKVADICKKTIVKSDAKAFKLPDNKNFLISGAVDTDCNQTELADRIIDKFSSLHKFIFILNLVGIVSKKRIAALCKSDTKTIEAAIDAEKLNIERLSDGKADYGAIYEVFKKRSEIACISAEADKEMNAIIADISAPYQKKARKGAIGITAIVLAVCLLVTGVVAIIVNNKPEPNKLYLAEIEIEDYGTIKLELDPSIAPITVKNFVDLAESGFYDGLTFHRIIEGFMMQGGDPDGNGTGGSDKEIYGEFTENGFVNNLSHKRGVISMARSNDPDSASSQFFIMHKDNAGLNGKYAAFGWVTEGMDVVDAVCESAEPIDGNGTIPAAKQPVIKSIKITGTKDAE